jgi:copper(I)-binding protein
MRAALLLVAALAAACTSVDAAPPVVREAWVALPPPGAPVTAGYFVLDNPGASAIELVGIESTDFARIELHETVMTEGRARMQPRPRLSVAAAGQVEARPGGLHLMLHDARQPLAAGTRIALVFRLADGRRLHATAEVRDPRPTDDHAHHH